ncbi:Rz1-like lysis system protein LysC [Burkholderia cepacia]|uniref:Rz1-like lysis system protein LysC n=1 Tax=Burkholderia cepacia TaxID=292 RepID=UPI001CF302BA|nr:Rz1-like lysis system protein LysC [Burkholderia cepacia]MCA8165171.1 Rz1-like lysis system protein LysC [Burkholderia cepacia]
MCACTAAPPSSAPTITLNACATVTRCTLPATDPQTNGDLSDALTVARAAWARCAAEVDMIAACQARNQTNPQPQASRHD